MPKFYRAFVEGNSPNLAGPLLIARSTPKPCGASSQPTHRWRGESAANSSRKMPNSLLAGNIQGISSIRALAARQWQPKTISNQYLTGQFPKHPNREFFAALQGIKSGDQGNFRPDQGIPLSTAISAAALPTNRIVPTDLERCREGGTGTPPDARGRRSRSPARGRLCPSERRARHAQNRSPSLSTRTIGVPGLHDGAWSRRARPGCTELTADGGPRVRIHLPPAASHVRT